MYKKGAVTKLKLIENFWLEMMKISLTFWQNSVEYYRSARADKFLGLVEERGPIMPIRRCSNG